MQQDMSSWKEQYKNWLTKSQDLLLKGAWKEASKSYPFLSISNNSLSPFQARLKYSRVAVLTTAGLYLKERQEPFNTTEPAGDYSWREIPKNIFADDLDIAHEYFPVRYARQDINVVMPLERLRKLEEREFLGEIADKHYSINGFISDASGIEEKLANPLLNALKEDEIDFLFLIPVTDLCHQTVALLQQYLEKNGMPTISVATNRKLVDKIRPPRVCIADFPEASPLGEPGNEKMQLEVIDEIFTTLASKNEPGLVYDLPFTWQDPFA